MWFVSQQKSQDEEHLLLESPTLVDTPLWTPASNSFESLIRLGKNATKYTALFLVPSFWRSRPQPKLNNEKVSQSSSPEKYATAYLDGVRGFASLIVFNFHWTHMAFPSVNSGYGYKDNLSLWQLPIIRFIYSGPAMVAIFFVVSGFVLTHRFIQRMHLREYEALYKGLTSMTIRRGVRLFLPALASCSLTFALVCIGLLRPPEEVGKQAFHHGVLAFVDYLDNESDPWKWSINMSGFYNPQLWSVSVEYRGSMVVFLMVLGLARSRMLVRLMAEILLAAHAFGHKRWDVGLFVAGMLVAEVNVIVHQSISAKAFVGKIYFKIMLATIMLLGVHLCGYPRDHPLESYGYQWSAHLWPFSQYRRRFWVGLGALCVVAPLSLLPSMQALFSIRCFRYLGKVSFALYLIHGLTNRTLGRWLLDMSWRHIGKEEYSARFLSYIVATVLYVPFVAWASDVFWRAFDVPATEFAKWLEVQCASKNDF